MAGSSGGELGARNGPSLMPGGDREGYKELEPILTRIAAVWPLEPLVPARPGEVAARYRYLDGGGEIGVIQSVSEARSFR